MCKKSDDAHCAVLLLIFACGVVVLFLFVITELLGCIGIAPAIATIVNWLLG
jgi:hypothetical protein